jgi:hypothetical protein
MRSNACQPHGNNPISCSAPSQLEFGGAFSSIAPWTLSDSGRHALRVRAPGPEYKLPYRNMFRHIWLLKPLRHFIEEAYPTEWTRLGSIQL